MNQIKIYLVLLLFATIGSNVLSQNAGGSATPKKAISREEKDVIQIRNIESTYQDALKAVVNALDALGYEEINAKSNIGLITATLPEEDLSDSTASRTASALASAFTFGIVGNDDKTTVRTRDITVLVTSIAAKNNKVKITLKQATTTETTNWVSSTKKELSDLTEFPKVYEDIFKEIANQAASLSKLN